MSYISAVGTGFKLSAKDSSIEVTDQTTDWEKWVITNEDGYTTFKGRSGEHGYLSAQPDGSLTYSEVVGETEKFALAPNPDGTVAIKSIPTGKFIVASEYSAITGDEAFGWAFSGAEAAPAPAPEAAEEPPIVPMGEEVPLEPAQ